jgi:GDP-6-deoxy-D-talose 4-dehydrogenase
MKRVLITGAAGFTGRHLIRALSDELHVGGLVHLRSEATFNLVEPLFEADLLDVEALKSAIAEFRPDSIVHLGAVSFVAHGNADEIYQVNLIGTRNLLIAARDAGCGQVILASSASVYGNAAGTVNEAVCPAPVNDYAVSKLAVEFLAGCFPDLAITILRLFNYTGLGQSDRFVVAKIVEHVRRRAAVIKLGNLDVERDYSDVRMIISAYRKVLLAEDTPRGIFNVCSGVGRSLLDIVSLACSISGHEMKVEVDPRFVRENEVRRLVGDATRFQAEIGSLPIIGFEDTLGWMVNGE